LLLNICSTNKCDAHTVTTGPSGLQLAEEKAGRFFLACALPPRENTTIPWLADSSRAERFGRRRIFVRTPGFFTGVPAHVPRLSPWPPHKPSPANFPFFNLYFAADGFVVNGNDY
jgi:hypothetical protein